MTKKTKKTIFTVINLANTEADQKNVVMYAAQLAKWLELDLVLYPKSNETKLSFKEGFAQTIELAKKVKEVSVHVSKQQINIFNFLQDLHSIAKKESAAFIIMGIEEKSMEFLGKAIWTATQKSLIPTILLPHGIKFKPYDRITIAVDLERKVQKMNVVGHLAATFNSMINIFIENIGYSEKEYLIHNTLGHIEDYLTRINIAYTKMRARKNKNFTKHLCKYSAKNSDLLVVEVEPGKIDSILKQNIGILLSIDKYAQPVMLTKTRMVGTLPNFN